MIVRKLLVNDGRAEREVLLVGTIVVGRDPSCQLTDLDPLLSRRHAEFVPSNKGVTVRDLKSRNGILVNGDKVPERLLKPGDVVQLGHLHVRYVEELVVKSPEDHTRVSAITETGIEVPEKAPIFKPVASVPMASAAAAPTSAAPAVTSVDDTDLRITAAPIGRVAPAVSTPLEASGRSAPRAYQDVDATAVSLGRPSAPPAAGPNDDTRGLPPLPPIEGLRRGRADQVDPDATLATLRRSTPPAPVPNRKDDDADATRLLRANATAVADDPDATVASKAEALDETRMPVVVKPHAPAAPVKTGPSREARIVANMSLIVTDASPSCQTVIGARPETIVGGGLSDVLARTLRFVATGDGPSALSMSVARATSGNTITVTFKTGQVPENHS